MVSPEGEALKGPEILTLDSPGLFDLPANSLSHSSPDCGDRIGCQYFKSSSGSAPAPGLNYKIPHNCKITKVPPYIDTHYVSGLRLGYYFYSLNILHLVLPQGLCTCCSLCLTGPFFTILQSSFLVNEVFPLPLLRSLF